MKPWTASAWPQANDRRIRKSQTSRAGTVFRRRGLTGMDKFFLAIMVSAVLLLIVAADLLISGPGMLEPAANVAKVVPVPGRLFR